ncbi:origin recognition complex subunit 4 [Ophiostoma piceae UAMH 11346]|uniref:Origin recognition complex subunit 4 n=1 Tax=Ophiostoma piceae (strain UAMH 11346) TaxID=1262450 RepID=S3C5A7_OPHP1|nr:origin recognition complex subunit 4 [Ophiostoma piceae UAMH 11346]
MSGINGSRKRARSDADDVDADATTADTATSVSTTTTGIKRQRLANEPPSIVVNGGSHGAADTTHGAGRLSALATTPKTPRTVHAMASAITGALAYGVGSLVGGGRMRGKSVSNQHGATLVPRSLASSHNETGTPETGAQMLNDIMGGDVDAEGFLDPDATDTEMPETPTSKKPASVARRSSQQPKGRRNVTDANPAQDDDKEENATLVGSASPTSDTPSKNPLRAPLLAEAGTTETPAATTTPAKKRGRKPKDPSQPTTLRKTPAKGTASARKNATPKAATPNGDAPIKRGRGRPRKHPIVEEDPILKLAQAKARSLAKQQLLQQQKAVDEDDGSGEVCLICSKPDSEPPNEIILCETCDLAVHQQCYNVPVIPEGDWFCKNCVRKQEHEKQLQKRASETPAGDETEEETGTDRQPLEPPTAHEKDDLAAELVAATPPRDLAPDIANFESHLSKTKRILLGRCTGRHRVRLHGQDEAYDKVYQVVEQTVVAGEGNSMMVIGARGTGKTTMVETILDDLAAEHGGAFHVVRLNGFIHTDDKLALREIWRQLGKEMAVDDDVVSKTNNYADTLASLLALLSHPSEIQAAAVGSGAETATSAPAVTSTSVVFIMDEFDLFATHARQTLLYNLFDIAQARKAPIAVLGLTTKIDVVESLEKRVKSRFSHRYVYLSLPRSLPAFWDVCRYGLVVEEPSDTKDGVMAVDIVQEEGHAAFQQWWKHMIDTAKDDSTFQEQLEFHFYSNKSIPAFWTTCVMPLVAVSSAAPRLRLPPVGCNNTAATTEVVRSVGRPSLAAAAASSAAIANAGKSFEEVPPLPLAAPDSKLHLLASLSELELSLLITAARLDIVLSTDTVNFAMAYDEYVSLMGKQRVQSSLASSGVVGIGGAGAMGGGLVIGGGARVWGRGVASRAWERLAALGLLIPAGMGANSRGRPGALITSGLEGRSMWRSEVSLEEIPAAPGVKLGAVLGRWCKEI